MKKYRVILPLDVCINSNADICIYNKEPSDYYSVVGEIQNIKKTSENLEVYFSLCDTEFKPYIERLISLGQVFFDIDDKNILIVYVIDENDMRFSNITTVVDIREQSNSSNTVLINDEMLSLLEKFDVSDMYDVKLHISDFDSSTYLLLSHAIKEGLVVVRNNKFQLSHIGKTILNKIRIETPVQEEKEECPTTVIFENIDVSNCTKLFLTPQERKFLFNLVEVYPIDKNQYHLFSNYFVDQNGKLIKRGSDSFYYQVNQVDDQNYNINGFMIDLPTLKYNVQNLFNTYYINPK